MQWYLISIWQHGGAEKLLSVKVRERDIRINGLGRKPECNWHIALFGVCLKRTRRVADYLAHLRKGYFKMSLLQTYLFYRISEVSRIDIPLSRCQPGFEGVQFTSKGCKRQLKLPNNFILPSIHILFLVSSFKTGRQCSNVIINAHPIPFR